MRVEYCLRCGRRRRAGEWACPAPCACDAYGASVPGDVDLELEVVAGDALEGPLGGLLRLPPGEVALIYGPPGAGKTTLALVALRSARPWVASSEQEPRQVLAYARRLGAVLAGVSRPELVELEDGRRVVELEVRVPPGERAPDLVLDSISATGAPELALDVVREYCATRGARAFVLSQVTQEGTARGPKTLEHLVDAVVEVGEGPFGREITVHKTRSGPTGSAEFELGDAGAVAPELCHFYAVTGRAPAYRLEPWPYAQSRYADVLREQERRLSDEDAVPLRLPPAPCAVAAWRSPLYPAGWVEPPDWRRRADYARRRGVRYFSPVFGLLET